MEISVLGDFFQGFFWAAVFPSIVGVYIAVKRALWSSAFAES